MNNVRSMVHWINERRSIFVLQQFASKLHGPLTDDPILAKYRFCNVHREDDRVTKWIRANMRTSMDSHPEAAMTLARLLNRPMSIELSLNCMGRNWDFDLLGKVLKEYRESGVKIFNAAYIVSTCGKKMDKIDYILGVVKDVYNMNWSDLPSECCFYSSRLQFVDGLGTFLAGQIVADLKNEPCHPLCDAEDKDTFVVPGPGSLRGLGWLVGSKVTPSTFEDYFWQAYHEVTPQVNDMPYIDAQDFQNCLCEFDKWMRAKEGTGKPKQKYTRSYNDVSS